MSGRGPDVPFWSAGDRFPTNEGNAESTAHGVDLRAARKSAGMDVSTAARTLKITASKLVQLELGSLRFKNPADYARAAQNLRTGAARAAKERDQ